MKKGWRLLAAAAVTLLIAGLTYAQAPSLLGTSSNNYGPLDLGAEGTEVLMRGDGVADQGLGCSNGSGTSGGPNDWALGVTATATTPPFQVVNMSYNMFTNISPNITSMSFVAWAGGAAPGAEVGRVAGLPFAQGTNAMAFTAGVAPTINSAAFFFGLNQNQSNVGVRIGQDTSTTGNSFIRAPTCGASNFTLADNLGFAGEWVMAATIDIIVPVELEAFDIN